jgi:hypothetical protein
LADYNDCRLSLKPALFLHIQKTAGSSIVDLARLSYGSDEVVSHGDYLSGWANKELDKIVNARGQSPENFSDKLFVSGHFGFDFARPLLRGRYSFTFLRDPLERILSYYYFCKTRDPKEYEIYALAQSMTIDQFLILGFKRPAVKACIWNNQAWQLANGYGNSNGRNILSFTPEEILELAIRHLDAFTYIGFTETFEKDRNHILKALGIIPPQEKIISNANPGRPTSRDLSIPTLKLLNELTQLDRALYEAAWRRKNSLFEKYLKKFLPFL